MPARFRTKDRVLETSVTTGAGTYTLAGAATGFQTFVGGDVAAGDFVPYFAEDGINWELGIGEVLSGPSRLARTTVLKSSNANAAVDWGAGTRNLRCGWPAELNTPRVKSVSIAGGAGAQALTQDQQRCDVLILTGAITGNRDVEVDTAPWRWIVFNNTSGAFSVTVKVNGGTGVAVAQGKSKVLYCDGTDVEDGNTDGAAASEAAAGVIKIATEAEIRAGASNVLAATPGRLLGALGFSAYFQSAEQTITSAGALTIAHGLGRKPVIVTPILKCASAEANYSVGDEVMIDYNNDPGGTSNRSFSCVPDATNLNVRYGSNATPFTITDKTTGAAANVTNANWRLILRAWA